MSGAKNTLAIWYIGTGIVLYFSDKLLTPATRTNDFLDFINYNTDSSKLIDTSQTGNIIYVLVSAISVILIAMITASIYNNRLQNRQ